MVRTPDQEYAFCVPKQARVRDERYDSLVEEVVTALRRRYGPSLLLHWEDFAAGNAFRLLCRYRAKVRRINLALW